MSGAPEADRAALADELRRRLPELSARVIAEMYRDDPFWTDRFGARGRQHADEDGGYHVSYLVEAVRSGAPSVITRYGQWLRSVLVSRGMCSRHLADNFARLADALAAEGEPAFGIAVDLLRQAETALLYDAPAPRALQDRAAQLARAAVDDLRAAHPDWWSGAEAGWRRCQDDLLLHVAYLADALAADRPDLFTTYTRFMVEFLRKRGAPPAYLEATLAALDCALQANGEPADAGLPLLRGARATPAT